MWLQEIFMGGAEGIFKGVADVVKTFKADPLEIAKFEQALRQAELQVQVSLTQAQTKINEIEAASNDKFVSRWRPSVGWVCVSGLVYDTLFQPLASWVCVNLSAVSPPSLDTALLTAMLSGLLGLGAFRTYEKTRQH